MTGFWRRLRVSRRKFLVFYEKQLKRFWRSYQYSVFIASDANCFRTVSYTFQMLSYYCDTSLIFIGSYCAFLFTVTINQSQTWDNLLRPRKEIFLTIASNVAFSCIIMLNTQHSLMRFIVFLSVLCWLHLVSGHSSLFQVVSTCSKWFQIVPETAWYFL